MTLLKHFYKDFSICIVYVQLIFSEPFQIGRKKEHQKALNNEYDSIPSYSTGFVKNVVDLKIFLVRFFSVDDNFSTKFKIRYSKKNNKYCKNSLTRRSILENYITAIK